LTGVHPAQFLPTGCQVATHHGLHQPQHPQTDTQQVHQTRHRAVDLQVHRPSAQRLTLEPREAVLDPILTAITQHHLVQRQPRLVGHIDASTTLLFLDLDSGLIDSHQHADLPKHHHVRRTASVPASGAFRTDRLHPHVDQVRQLVSGQDLLGVGIWQRFATKWAIVFADSSQYLG
jgi:hypothetical protein